MKCHIYVINLKKWVNNISILYVNLPLENSIVKTFDLYFSELFSHVSEHRHFLYIICFIITMLRIRSHFYPWKLTVEQYNPNFETKNIQTIENYSKSFLQFFKSIIKLQQTEN